MMLISLSTVLDEANYRIACCLQEFKVRLIPGKFDLMLTNAVFVFSQWFHVGLYAQIYTFPKSLCKAECNNAKFVKISAK